MKNDRENVTKVLTGKVRRRAVPDNFVDGNDRDNVKGNDKEDGLHSERRVEGSNIFQKARLKSTEPVDVSECYGTYSHTDPACKGCYDADRCARLQRHPNPNPELIELLKETRKIKKETLNLFIKFLEKIRDESA